MNGHLKLGESDEYTGPDMTDSVFAHNKMKFKVQYDEQMELFKRTILE